MEFKEGIGWRCCYDPETGRYTAETGGGPNHNLYEITKEIYDHVDDPDVKWPTSLISEGRHLYMTVNDRCGPPYTVILDSDYKKICPWAETITTGAVWGDDLTDAAVEVFASEANNREQRRAKKAAREKAAAANRITLRKADDLSSYSPQIDDTDADADFFADLFEDEEDIFAICLDEKTVGLSVIAREGDSGFLYIYVFPAYRRRGYGYAAARLAEQQILSPDLRSMETAYPENDAAAESFAEKCGFTKKYASARMKYRGEKVEIPPLPIRPYEDKDYLDAFTLSAEAFHQMRLETGCFPESVPETPGEESREHWRNTADERYVYVLDDEIVGYAHVEGNELASVSIKIAHQGKGLGRGFVRFLVNLILEKGVGVPCLWCVVGNNKARQLYDSLGFEEVSRQVFALKNVL